MNIEDHTETKTVADIFDWYKKQRKGDHRPHLGGSQIGNECSRALWYQFRHMDRPTFNGRMLRLFETGDREEGRIIANLRSIGVTVWDLDPETGKQIRFTAHDGHFALSLDGVAEGIPDAPKKPHIVEMKTANEKSFRATKSKGVKEAKPVYYAQVQAGMHLSGIHDCLFLMKNKNDESLYGERIKYDPAYAIKLIAKAGEIIYSDRPPEKIRDDPSFYLCKFCDYHHVCHQEKIPEVNCRTCAHATPEKGGDGKWSCAKNQDFGKVCKLHLFHPYAMPWEIHDAGPDWIEYQTGDGEIIRNSENSQKMFDEWVPF